MPGTFSSRRDETRYVEWLTLFADRDEPRRRIADFLQALQDPNSSPDPSVLQFFGISGQGKSSLFRYTQSIAPAGYPRTRFAFVDFDNMETERSREPVEVLWRVTNAFSEAGILTPLTLCLYAYYWKQQNPGLEFRLDRIFREDFLERCIRGCEMLGTFEGFLKAFSEYGQVAFKTLAVIEKLFAEATSRYRELMIEDFRGSHPGKWDLQRIKGQFQEFLAWDILAHLKEHGDQSVCLVVDTFERLDPGEAKDECERGFQDLCARLIDAHERAGQTVVPSQELRGRTGVLLFGRERIRWNRYDAPGALEPWSNFIAAHELKGFTEVDAREFLRGPFSNFWNERAKHDPSARGVAPLLVEHESAILAAACETLGPPREIAYVPYFLRLAGETIYEQGARFTPEMLGRTPDDMQERFLRYLRESSPYKLRALQTLVIALYFDEDLFAYLVRGHRIEGIPVQDFESALIANRSYIRPFEDNGKTNYRFHRHMQQALLAIPEKYQEEAGAASRSIEAILEYYASAASFATVADFVPEQHLPPYEHAMEILLTFAERNAANGTRASNWFGRLEAPFDDATATRMRVPIHVRWLAIVEKSLPVGHPYLAAQLSNLALLYVELGQYEKAEPLCVRSLSMRESALPPAPRSVAAGLNHLADVYQAQRLYKKAEPLFVRALALCESVLPADHPDVAIGLTDLAGVYRDQEMYEKAEPLFVRALAILVKVPGGHSVLATCLNHLAALYSKQGQYEKAEPLCVRSLEIYKNLLGERHTYVATAAATLATLYVNEKEYEKAEPLFVRALAIWEKERGPDLAIGLENYASLLEHTGRESQATVLRKRAADLQPKHDGSR